MTMEVRLENADGELVYRRGVREITNSDERVWLIFGEEAEETGAAEVLAGETEEFFDATIEVVKLEGETSLQEQDDLVGEWADNHPIDTDE